MDQSTTPKPVMDVTPPKPTTPAVAAPSPVKVLPPSDADLASNDTGPAAHASMLPPSDADSGGLPSANPSLAQEDLRTDTVAGDAEGGAQLSQASAEHTGKATDAAGPVSGGSKESLAVHTAPPLSDDDKANAAPETTEPQATHPKPTAHSGASKNHGPAAAITFVVLAMIVLSALAVLVYLNS